MGPEDRSRRSPPEGRVPGRDPQLCRHLRWKSFYGRDWGGAEELEATFAWNEVPYDCLRTSQPWGPDEHPATPECCGAQRSCFERSKLFPDAAGGGAGSGGEPITLSGSGPARGRPKSA
jgi:hypothetical protein